MSDSGDAVARQVPGELDKQSPDRGPRSRRHAVWLDQADMEATRQRLASTLDKLKGGREPENIASRQVIEVKAFYHRQVRCNARRPGPRGTVGVVVAIIVVRRTWSPDHRLMLPIKLLHDRVLSRRGDRGTPFFRRHPSPCDRLGG